MSSPVADSIGVEAYSSRKGQDAALPTMRNIKVHSIVVTNMSTSDPVFHQLDRRFRLSTIPLLGKLFAKYAVVRDDDEKPA